MRERRLKKGDLEGILGPGDPPAFPPIIRRAIETGMRRGEIARLTWDDVDLKRRTLTLETTKSGEGLLVPLSKDAVGILSTLPRRLGGTLWGIRFDWISHGFRDLVVRA